MEQIFNPYLPLWEYIPDGEPHVFGERVYIYGSHDRANGKVYCEQHYQVWSAPVDNLHDWRSEGVSYLRSQDPTNADDTMQLWAPDVTQGPDGRYYLYYCFSFCPEIGVAVSDKPDSGFRYGGPLVSNGDIGLNGRTTPVYPLGNNHGGLVEIGDELYIFYHRQTNGTEFSRQGCAERVELRPDGSIPQAEITSCGLNGGALAASGVYPAAIACHLTDPTVKNLIDYAGPALKEQVRITEQENQTYVTNVKDKTVIGYKYFRFSGPAHLALELRGSFRGSIVISQDEAGKTPIGALELGLSSSVWQLMASPIRPGEGDGALYLHFTGEGTLDMKSLAFLA